MEFVKILDAINSEIIIKYYSLDFKEVKSRAFRVEQRLQKGVINGRQKYYGCHTL